MKKVLALILLVALSGCSMRPDASSPDPGLSSSPQPVPSPVAQPTPSPEPVATPEPTPEPTPEESPQPTPEPSTAPDKLSARLLVGGDLVLHLELYDDCKTADGYDFTSLFSDVRDIISEADYAQCCFEGAMMGDGAYTGYPFFRVPDELAASLAEVGFDMVSLASNHGIDGFEDGLIRTIDVFEQAGMDHIGTYRSPEEREATGGVLLKEINGIRIAYLNYSYGTNGIPMDGYEWAMNVYYQDYMDNLSIIRYDMIDEDIAYAKSLEPDIIAVVMHWGAEYITGKQPNQISMAEHLFAQGVDLILGGHPHVPQPMETVEVALPDGTTKTGYICYCLGNLVSAMTESGHANSTLTALASIELEKDLSSGETYIKRVEYTPCVMMDLYYYGITWGSWRYQLWDIRSAIEDYEAGNTRGGIMSTWMYNCLVRDLGRCHDIIGPELVYEVEANG